MDDSPDRCSAERESPPPLRPMAGSLPGQPSADAMLLGQMGLFRFLEPAPRVEAPPGGGEAAEWPGGSPMRRGGTVEWPGGSPMRRGGQEIDVAEWPGGPSLRRGGQDIDVAAWLDPASAPRGVEDRGPNDGYVVVPRPAPGRKRAPALAGAALAAAVAVAACIAGALAPPQHAPQGSEHPSHAAQRHRCTGHRLHAALQNESLHHGHRGGGGRVHAAISSHAEGIGLYPRGGSRGVRVLYLGGHASQAVEDLASCGAECGSHAVEFEGSLLDPCADGPVPAQHAGVVGASRAWMCGVAESNRAGLLALGALGARDALPVLADMCSPLALNGTSEGPSHESVAEWVRSYEAGVPAWPGTCGGGGGGRPAAPGVRRRPSSAGGSAPYDAIVLGCTASDAQPLAPMLADAVALLLPPAQEGDAGPEQDVARGERGQRGDGWAGRIGAWISGGGGPPTQAPLSAWGTISAAYVHASDPTVEPPWHQGHPGGRLVLQASEPLTPPRGAARAIALEAGCYGSGSVAWAPWGRGGNGNGNAGGAVWAPWGRGGNGNGNAGGPIGACVDLLELEEGWSVATQVWLRAPR